MPAEEPTPPKSDATTAGEPAARERAAGEPAAGEPAAGERAAGVAAQPAGAPAAIRDRLALAFDTDDLVDALRLARELSPWFGVAKVGMELFCATGPES